MVVVEKKKAFPVLEYDYVSGFYKEPWWNFGV